MAELAVSKQFLAAYAKLPLAAQRAVDAAIGKFSEHTHAGLHMEKLQGACDSRIRTIRVTQFYRGVVLALGQRNYVLVTVMPHDDANTYAMNHLFSVNPVLGVLEVRDEARLQEWDRAMAPVVPGGLFDRITDDELCGLGVELKLIPCIRAFTTDTQLEALAHVLPDAQYSVLTGLASGMSIDEVRRETDSREVSDVDTEDLLAAAQRTPERIRFVSGPTELADILAHPFDAWRTFLHPTQRDIAFRETYSGPAYITGSAGTGKTVTGLHRAVFLAKRLPADGSKVLITTYTRALDQALERQLRLLTNDRAVLERIDVINVDRLAHQIVKGSNKKITVPDEAVLRRLWDAAAKNGPTYFTGTGKVASFSGAFLQREWEQVILAQRLTTMESYRDAPRHGTGGALRADQRERVWAAVSNVLEELTRSRQRTHLQLADEAASLATHLYLHVIVDEGQDLHPAQWRMLRALVPPGPNDMFLLGDPHQRIYDNHVSLKRLGINIQGRSRRLTINYRTTHEILDWSVKVLTGSAPVGLDDETDSLNGYRSVTRGQRPELVAHADRAAETDSLIVQVGTWLEQGVEPHAIGVAARTNQLAVEFAKALREAHIPVAGEDNGGDGVNVLTMHRAKGLEFQCLAVAGLDAGVLPAAHMLTDPAADPVSHKQDLMRERCLLFVAVTRARDVLYLSHAGRPSTLLPEFSGSR